MYLSQIYRLGFWSFSIFLFLLIWSLDSIVTPLFATLDLGFGILSNSSHLVRYGSILAFFTSVAPIFITFTFKLKKYLFLYAFTSVIFIGICIAILSGNNLLSSPFFSHLFYYLMPIFVFQFGWKGFILIEQSPILKSFFRLTMKIMFWSGFICSLLFAASSLYGFSSYSALGIWNLIFTMPYMFFSGSKILSLLSFLATILTAKRTSLVVLLSMIFLSLFLIKSFKRKILYLTILALFSSPFFLFSSSAVSNRIVSSFNNIASGDFDAASANRLAEFMAALNSLNSDPWSWLTGKGFGAIFYPWDHMREYILYQSHYVHFTPLSYIWSGGILAFLATYGLIFYLLFSLLSIHKSYHFTNQYPFLIYWVLSIFTASLFGASLVNNSYLWFILGFSASFVNSVKKSPSFV